MITIVCLRCLTTSPPDKKTRLSALYRFDLKKKSSPKTPTLNKLFNKVSFFLYFKA